MSNEGLQILYRSNSSQAVVLDDPYFATRSAIVDLSQLPLVELGILIEGREKELRVLQFNEVFKARFLCRWYWMTSRYEARMKEPRRSASLQPVVQSNFGCSKKGIISNVVVHKAV